MHFRLIRQTPSAGRSGPVRILRLATALAMAVGLAVLAPTDARAQRAGLKLTDAEATCPRGPHGDGVSAVPAGAQPVVLVHGWSGGPGSMDAIRDGIRESLGAQVATFRFDYSATADAWAGRSEVAGCLAMYIDEVSAASRATGGTSKVLLVGYSMGGLAIRYAAALTVHGRKLGDDIGGVVTVDTPHLGSSWGGTGYARLIAEATRILGGDSHLTLPSPDSDAAHCLVRHSEGGQYPAECGAPPFLPAGVPIQEIDGEVSIQRTLGRIVPLYTYNLNGDSVVDNTSQIGYAFSGSGTPPATSLHTTVVGCTVTTDILEGYALKVVPSAVNPLVKAIEGWRGDAAAMDDILDNTVSYRSLPLLVIANLAAPCSHLQITSNGQAIAGIVSSLRSWLPPPQWLIRLKANRIIPGVGLAGVRLGISDSDLTRSLGVGVGRGPVTTGDGRVLYYDTGYRYEGIYLGFYSTLDTHRVFSISLFDADFNDRGLLPNVRQHAGIGATASVVMSAFGQPISKRRNSFCAPQLSDVTATIFNYPGIDFWVCSNSKVYEIEIFGSGG